MSGKKCTTRVNLSETERENLLNRLDNQSIGASAPTGGAKTNRRRHKRWSFREVNVTVSVEHPAGGISRFLVYTRDISAGGLSFVHGGYLHEGSICQVLLRTCDGQIRTIPGTIVSCRHLEGLMHLSGLRFDRRIDPATFVNTSKAMSTPSETIASRVLKGSILYIDDCIDDRDLIKYLLEACDAQVHTVANGIEGLAVFEQKRFDVVLTELEV